MRNVLRRQSGASPKLSGRNGGGAALGYIVIGLLAFLLGVCVTVLCFRLRQMNREDGQDRESKDAHGTD